MQESESYTKTVESGAFIRTKIRKGRKTKTKTKRMQKNDKKVILGHIGDFELYAYPFQYPDVVFIGQFPVSTCIDNANINQLISCYNKARAYLAGNYFSEPNFRKGANSRRRDIQRAYNCGLNEISSKEQPSFK